MAERLLFQFRAAKDEPPSLADVAGCFGLAVEQISSDYGVVKIADENGSGIYSVLVDAEARERVEAQLAEDDSVIGFFSNPHIEPFGPPM